MTALLLVGDLALVAAAGREELYNLLEDLEEEHDLAPGAPALVQKYRDLLDQILKNSRASGPVSPVGR